MIGQRPLFFVASHLLPAAICLCLAGCHRGPQTAAELRGAMPREFRGEIHVQGDPQVYRLVVEPQDLAVQSEHRLGFGGVRYQVLARGEVLADGEAGVRGTISTPDLKISVDGVTDTGAEAIRPETFVGHLSTDLRTIDAEWTSGSGQKVDLKATAVAR